MKTPDSMPNNLDSDLQSNTDAKVSAKGNTAIPRVEEELQVGKREVETGGVRVENKMVERPVEETVRLREEQVNVERRPVNRPISTSEVAAMQDGSVEFVEHGEEAVVAKRARVVEEVVVSKNVGSREETIRDNLRYNVVNVTPIAAKGSAASAPVAGGIGDHDATFREDFARNGYEKKGYKFEQFSPVYQYGHDLAKSNDYKGRSWPSVETDVRNKWESHNPNTWDQVKSAVQHAWEKVTGA